MEGTEDVGLPLVAAHLGAVGASLLLLLVWLGIGASVRRVLRADWPGSVLSRWPVDVALGLGAMATVFLALGAVGLLLPPIVLGVVVLSALAVHRELTSTVLEARAAARAIWDGGWPSRTACVIAVLLAVLLLAGAVAPPTEWDSLMYHLRIPLGFLETGRVSPPVDSFHVALVGAAHLAMLPLLAAGIITGPATMQVCLLFLTIAGTVALARAAGETRGGSVLAAVVLLGSPALILVAITARVDVAVVLVLLAAHLAVLDASARASSRSIIVAAVLVGTALAIKPYAGVYALALAPLGWRAAGGWRPALAAVAYATVIAAPWYLKNFLLVGAPFYPIGAPGWLEPWLAEIFGGRVPPADLDASILRALPRSRESFDLWAAFVAPERLTIEMEGRHYALSPAFLLAPLALLRWRTRRAVAVLAVVGIVYCVLIVVPFGRINLRYLMPAFPALAVAAAAVASAVLDARVRPLLRTAGIVLFVTAACWPLGDAIRARFGGDKILLRHALGLSSAGEVWGRHPDNTVRMFASVPGNVQRVVPEGGRVLLLWEARALPLRRRALTDVALSNWSYLAQSPAYDDCLAGRDITHVLVNSGALGYYLRRGADRKPFYLERLAAFRARCLGSPVQVGPGFDLYEVVAPAK
jgi:hypothetical protein